VVVVWLVVVSGVKVLQGTSRLDLCQRVVVVMVLLPSAIPVQSSSSGVSSGLEMARGLGILCTHSPTHSLLSGSQHFTWYSRVRTRNGNPSESGFSILPGSRVVCAHFDCDRDALG